MAIPPLPPQLETRLQEAFNQLWDNFIDPREALVDDDGLFWTEVSNTSNNSLPLAAERLADIRHQCRRLLFDNEFAINGVENRISYIVGRGHSYRAVVRKQADAPASLAGEVQRLLDIFLHENDWLSRQQEIVRRQDRDGEAFLRFFPQPNGTLRVRFIEPEQIVTPQRERNNPAASFGIVTDPHDVESVVGYYVDGQWVEASEIQHRRANVDRNVKRGLPLYTAVRSNLRRAEKLLRNMSVVAEIQSAIALIRKHRSASRSGVEQFVSNSTPHAGADSLGRIENLTKYGPGTIIDAPAGMEYDFPATGVDARAFVEILQAELRAIAARLVMPEFMFTSNASNANYASTMVSEGPAVRMFERLQASLERDDSDVMWRVIANAVAAGQLPENIRKLIEIQITPPPLTPRDALRNARVDQIAYSHGLLSLQSWSSRMGLDYDQEQKNITMHLVPETVNRSAE